MANIKNKYHSIYLDYKNSLMLKRIGYPQEGASAYWFINDKQVYPADRVAKSKGWGKLFIAAPSDAELNAILPDFMITRNARFYRAYLSGSLDKKAALGLGLSEAEAKAMLIKHLVKRKLLNLP
jgi:hypothetical protein